MLIYYGPNGQFVNNPSHEFLKNIIDKDPSYWSKGGGDSSLFFERTDSRLIFFKDKTLGVFIMKHPEYMAPYNPLIKLNTVYHQVGGEPMPLPSSCYIDEQRAKNYLIEYADTGDIKDSSTWKDIYELIDFEE
ncbi:hypothetical protein [Sporolactobacillus sp. KGMB 08714]|uniref:hypothetical protein n=1 Tax=Sporolactobacillus sp. KGMB 08714 TaxID=3064704 RepID=UPI002FBE79C6